MQETQVSFLLRFSNIDAVNIHKSLSLCMGATWYKQPSAGVVIVAVVGGYA